MLWLINDVKAKNILEKSYEICPWSKDIAYFKARIENIKYLINNITPEELLKNDHWLNYLHSQKPNTVGRAWKFWSTLMIFSELQIWSDY